MIDYKKRILVLSSEFPPLPGGIGNHAYFLSKYLKKKGFEVTVVTDHRSEIEDIEFDEKQSFKIFRIKRNKWTYFNRIKKAFYLAKRNQIILCSGKFSLWLGAFLSSFFSSKRCVAVLHGSELKSGGFFSQQFTKWSLQRFDSLIAVSEFTKKNALEINPKLQIQVINNGIEVSHFSNIKVNKQESLNLITVGNLTFRKGQQNMINALPFLKGIYPNIHYHCVGIPTEKEKFTALAKPLEVLENITFYGALSDVEKNEMLAKSSIFVMLSEHIKNDFEGFGIALLEANILGIPAIGSKDSGISDAIKNGYSGFLVNQHNPEEIEKAISEIMANYSVFSEQAKKWSEKFDWNIIVEKYIKIIKNEA